MKPGFKIKTIHAFIATEDDGTEGVIGQLMPDGVFMPFVCADAERVKLLRPFAAEIARMSNKPVKLARFSVREDLEDIE
jgi:hypothetical protein